MDPAAKKALAIAALLMAVVVGYVTVNAVRSDPAGSPPDAASAPRVAREKKPPPEVSITVRDDIDQDQGGSVGRAVLALCGSKPKARKVWRGAVGVAVSQAHMGEEVLWMVAVTFTDEAWARWENARQRGSTVMYRVSADRTTIAAIKDVSASLCGLPSTDTPHPFR